MDISPQHLLTHLGILKLFSVSKIIDAKEFDKISKLVESCSNTKEEYQELLNQEILNHINNFLKNNKIHGLIEPLEKSQEKKYKKDADVRLIALFSMAKKVSETLKTKSLSKHEICFFILNILEQLEVNDEDFEEYHRKNNDNNSESDGYDDFYSDEDGDDENGEVF